MTTHKFGGIWTQKKLAVLEAYLQFYVTALKRQPFVLHYADAFAGSGSHEPVTLDGQDLLIPFENFRGSVLTALGVEPGFGQYHFNDLNPGHVQELEKIRTEHPGKRISVTQQDANTFVADFCARLGSKDRAVLLLDPYSTQLDWDTLKHVAKSGKVDLWLLFPFSVILRMTPREETRVRPEWTSTLNRLLGTNAWEAELYKPAVVPPIEDLFGEAQAPVQERVNAAGLQSWVTRRLQEVFPYVAQPFPLRNRGRTLFLFYFAVSNGDPRAWGLADKVVSHIIDKNIGGD